MADNNAIISETAQKKDVLSSEEFNILDSKQYLDATGELKVPLGRREGGSIVVLDMHEVPHMLICGFTGSGKTAFVRTLLSTLATQYSCNKVSFVIYDSKYIEYSAFSDLKHMLLPIIADANKIKGVIDYLAAETRSRLQRFADARTKDLNSYNEYCKEAGNDKLPEVFFVMDDFAQCPIDRDILFSISEILRNGRIAGIHVIIVSSVVTAKVLPKEIISNIPCRLTFCLSSKAESKLILEEPGAEELFIPGEMLFRYQGMIEKCQCAHAEDENINKVLKKLKAKGRMNLTSLGLLAEGIFEKDTSKPMAQNTLEDYDEYIAQAGAIILEKQKATIGMLQRVFKIGFNRAERLMNQLEELGLVGEEAGTKPRAILLSEDKWNKVCRKHGWSEVSLSQDFQYTGCYASEDTKAAKTEDEPAIKLRDFEQIDVGENHIGVKNNKIQYAIRMLTRFGEEGTLRTEFGGVSIAGIIFKKAHPFSKGYLEFKFKPGVEITNEDPLRLTANKDNVSNLTRIEFDRYEEQKVWQFAKQISEDVQMPITLV